MLSHSVICVKLPSLGQGGSAGQEMGSSGSPDPDMERQGQETLSCHMVVQPVISSFMPDKKNLHSRDSKVEVE